MRDFRYHAVGLVLALAMFLATRLIGCEVHGHVEMGPAPSCVLPSRPLAVSCNDYRCVACLDDLRCYSFSGADCPPLAATDSSSP